MQRQLNLLPAGLRAVGKPFFLDCFRIFLFVSQPNLVMSTYGDLGTVLVTGGSGGLASQILRQLSASEGTTLHSIDIRRPTQPFDNVTYHLADLTDYAALRTVFEQVRPEVVFHTASPRFDSPKAIMNAVNIEATEKLVKVAKEFGTQSFIYTSSASVISDGKTDLVAADETYSLVIGAQQPEYYTHTKACTEVILLPIRATDTQRRP